MLSGPLPILSQRLCCAPAAPVVTLGCVNNTLPTDHSRVYFSAFAFDSEHSVQLSVAHPAVHHPAYIAKLLKKKLSHRVVTRHVFHQATLRRTLNRSSGSSVNYRPATGTNNAGDERPEGTERATGSVDPRTTSQDQEMGRRRGSRSCSKPKIKGSHTPSIYTPRVNSPHSSSATAEGSHYRYPEHATLSRSVSGHLAPPTANEGTNQYTLPHTTTHYKPATPPNIIAAPQIQYSTGSRSRAAIFPLSTPTGRSSHRNPYVAAEHDAALAHAAWQSLDRRHNANMADFGPERGGTLEAFAHCALRPAIPIPAAIAVPDWLRADQVRG